MLSQLDCFLAHRMPTSPQATWGQELGMFFLGFQCGWRLWKCLGNELTLSLLVFAETLRRNTIWKACKERLWSSHMRQASPCGTHPFQGLTTDPVDQLTSPLPSPKRWQNPSILTWWPRSCENWLCTYHPPGIVLNAFHIIDPNLTPPLQSRYYYYLHLWGEEMDSP